MIERPKYLKQLIDAKENGFPKVITGIRRCGKSYLLKDIYKKYLLDNGIKKENIIVLELDDDKNEKLRNPIELGKYIRSICTNSEIHYVFLDEIQKVYTIINPTLTEEKIILAKDSDKEVVSFVDVVLGLSREPNIDLYVTGSNSKMLSSDIITEFRDKATEIHMCPLSFEEFYNYVGGSKVDAFDEYMMHGGMPLAVLSSKQEKETYLKKLFQKTYFADILERNNINKSESFDELCKILSSSVGDLLNSDKIAGSYQSVKHEKIDKDTVSKYLSFFKDAFIINEVSRYDIKGRENVGAARKYYFTDIGLRNALLDFTFFDEGKVLENIIHNELVYRGFNFTVGTFESYEKDKNGKTIRVNYEMDFYATRGTEAYYFQIAADVNDLKTKNREIKPFTKINDGVQKVLIIKRNNPAMRDENGYTIIGAIDFILNFIKD